MRRGDRPTGTRVRALRALGASSVCAYVGVLIGVAIDHRIHGSALASSPDGVAAGRLIPLLTSGIVVDGPVWPQIALLAAVLIVALRRLGAVRLWSAAVSAHVGATLLAYAVIGVVWIVDPPLVGPVTGAPDFGISVVLTGELGALLAASRNRTLMRAGCLVLAVPVVVALAVARAVDPLVLACAEHAAGFWLGALITRRTRASRSAAPAVGTRTPSSRRGRHLDESRTQRLTRRPMCLSRPAPNVSRVIPSTGRTMINPRAHPISPTASDRQASDPTIREYRSGDADAILALSLRAWAPVFPSLEHELGEEIFLRIHGGWRHQANAVREVLADDAQRVWVAETERDVVGFVAATLDSDRRIGEITMLAVEPGSQRAGVGRALTEFATDWLRRAGMQVAMVETGGDPGHAAARGLYQTAGYTLLPVARYFKAL